MRIFLTGVSCVGKTTVGAKLAALLSCPFFDLDQEIERFFAMPIEPLQDQFLTMYAFRQDAVKALNLSTPSRGESRCRDRPSPQWSHGPLLACGETSRRSNRRLA
jgi:shikimate kinase